MFGQHIRDLLGPFNKAVIARVEILFAAHVQRLSLYFKAIKIKVVNTTVSTRIFIDNSKCWATNGAIYAQFGTKRFYEGGFASTHIAMKKKNAVVAGKT